MSRKQLALVIDLNVCVGCQACVTSCKEWNTQGYSAPLSDVQPYGADPMPDVRTLFGAACFTPRP